MAASHTLYPHMRNEDGSFDSICPKCYMIVAQSTAEAGLAEGETAHVCESSFFADYGYFSGASSHSS